MHTDNGAGDEHKRVVMAVVKQIEQRPKPSKNNEDLGLRWRFLNQALHGGGCSTYPQIYPIHGGSNDIVDTAWSGQQIIINNLNNDYNDSVIYKVKRIFTMINHRVQAMIKNEIFLFASLTLVLCKP